MGFYNSANSPFLMQHMLNKKVAKIPLNLMNKNVFIMVNNYLIVSNRSTISREVSKGFKTRAKTSISLDPNSVFKLDSLCHVINVLHCNSEKNPPNMGDIKPTKQSDIKCTTIFLHISSCCLTRGRRPATTISSPSHILLIFSSEPPLNPCPYSIIFKSV